MMSAVLPLNIDKIIPLISSWLYILFRVSSFFLVSPFFNQLSLPVFARVLLSMALSFVLASNLGFKNEIPDIYSTTGFFTVAQQIIIGVAMGLILRIIFESFNLVGQFVAVSLQLTFATSFNPFKQVQANILGNFFQLLGMLMFVSMHGPLNLIALLIKSFTLLPVSPEFISLAKIYVLPKWTEQMFIYGLSLALPIMSTLFVINIGLAVMMRVAPSLNIFSVGFPVTILTGFVALTLSLPSISRGIRDAIKHGYSLIFQWLGLH